GGATELRLTGGRAVTGPGGVESGLLGHLEGFIAALRRHGVAASVSEGLDAVRAFGTLDLLDREELRAVLAATLVKRAALRPAYDTLFGLWFVRGPSARARVHSGAESRSLGGPVAQDAAVGGLTAEDGAPGWPAAEDGALGGSPAQGEPTAGELRERLAELLAGGDDAGLRRLAGLAVQAL